MTPSSWLGASCVTRACLNAFVAAGLLCGEAEAAQGAVGEAEFDGAHFLEPGLLRGIEAGIERPEVVL
jgi:hypothetical protein